CAVTGACGRAVRVLVSGAANVHATVGTRGRERGPSGRAAGACGVLINGHHDVAAAVPNEAGAQGDLHPLARHGGHRAAEHLAHLGARHPIRGGGELRFGGVAHVHGPVVPIGNGGAAADVLELELGDVGAAGIFSAQVDLLGIVVSGARGDREVRVGGGPATDLHQAGREGNGADPCTGVHASTITAHIGVVRNYGGELAGEV